MLTSHVQTSFHDIRRRSHVGTVHQHVSSDGLSDICVQLINVEHILAGIHEGNMQSR